MGKREITHRGAASDPASGDETVRKSHEIHRKPASPPLPGRHLGAMDHQSGLALQSSQSIPQQFVRLVGHRRKQQSEWVRPRPKVPQMGGL